MWASAKGANGMGGWERMGAIKQGRIATRVNERDIDITLNKQTYSQLIRVIGGMWLAGRRSAAPPGHE